MKVKTDEQVQQTYNKSYHRNIGKGQIFYLLFLERKILYKINIDQIFKWQNITRKIIPIR